MFRSLSTLLGLLALALAVITAVLDLTRSIANSALTITPLGLEWFNFAPASLNLSQAIVQRYVHEWLWDPVIQSILLMPSWLVFVLLATLFLWLGRGDDKNWKNKFGK